MKRKDWIKVLLLLLSLITYYQEAFLSQKAMIFITAIYCLFSLVFSIINLIIKDVDGHKFKLGNLYIYNYFEFLWFIVGFFVMLKNINNYSTYMNLIFSFLLIYFLSMIKIKPYSN